MTYREEVIGDARLILGDALEVLVEMSSVDIVVSDPPYMMGSAATRAGKGYRSRLGEWTNAVHWYGAWFSACWSILPSHGSLWLCANWRSLPVLTLAADGVGASASSTVVWDKNWIGVGSMRGLRQRYELVVQFGKEDFAIKDRSAPDIWVVPWASKRPHGHESEKPVDLMERCLSFSEGQTVLDPFMGSGTTAIAALKGGRAFVGVEIDERYFDIACRRIEQAYRQPRPQQEAML